MFGMCVCGCRLVLMNLVRECTGSSAVTKRRAGPCGEGILRVAVSAGATPGGRRDEVMCTGVNLAFCAVPRRRMSDCGAACAPARLAGRESARRASVASPSRSFLGLLYCRAGIFTRRRQYLQSLASRAPSLAITISIYCWHVVHPFIVGHTHS